MTYECPECDDGGTIVQTIRQVEIVHTDEDGEPTEFEPIGGHDVLKEECDDCGHVLFDETAESVSEVFVVVAHPPETTSYVVDVFADRESAEEAKRDHEERFAGRRCEIVEGEINPCPQNNGSGENH